jgi:hypothetical protein
MTPFSSTAVRSENILTRRRCQFVPEKHSTNSIIPYFRGYRQQRYNETALSEARYSGVYRYCLCV